MGWLRHNRTERAILNTLIQVYDKLNSLEGKVNKIMATLDEVLADVTEESTAIDSVSALIAGLQQQLKDALAGATIPANVQTKIDAVFAQAEANKGKLAAALAANVPPAPAVPPAA